MKMYFFRKGLKSLGRSVRGVLACGLMMAGIWQASAAGVDLQRSDNTVYGKDSISI